MSRSGRRDKHYDDRDKYDNYLSHHSVSDYKTRENDYDCHRSRSSRRNDKTEAHSSKSSKVRANSKTSKSKRKSRKHSHSRSWSTGSSIAGDLTEQLLSLSSSESSDEETKQKKKIIAKQVANDEIERLERMEKERQRQKDDRKRQKELLKTLETPEEKRLRRMAKKDAKERKRKQLMGWDEEYMGYTNADNPFGDANLHKTFFWPKKYEKLGMKNIPEEEIDRMNRIKMEMNKKELEKVKQRRLEREREREERNEELAKMQREKEAQQFKEWEKQEDHFHLKQAKLRSKLRIKEGRAKPIDLLARYINAFGDNIDADEEDNVEKDDITTELVEPYLCLNGLRIADLEDLHEDIKIYMELDSKNNLDYWRDLQIIVEDELYKLKRFQSQNAVERREGINSAVSNEVTQVFKGKTPAQLQALQTQIDNKIRSGEEGIDIGYWETLLSRLKSHIARARLREMHEQNLRKKLIKLKQEQGVEQKPSNLPLFPCVSSNEDDFKFESNYTEIETPSTSRMIAANEASHANEENNEQFDPLMKCVDEYESGRYTPPLFSMNDLEAGTLVTDFDEDIECLRYQRTQILEADEDKKKALMTTDEIAFEREARKGMNNDEAMFSVEEPIKQDKNIYSWTDKYRPRKPRYFNRVHTGFEWNKYNQTHYDVDNPPPKVVQGYKFNIFYPDLIDKSKSPTFKITNCSDNKDFALIRFSSGPPYEDICFKIVNREWNYSYKSGFRSQFQNNILQLWFHFKRYRYRR